LKSVFDIALLLKFTTNCFFQKLGLLTSLAGKGNKEHRCTETATKASVYRQSPSLGDAANSS